MKTPCVHCGTTYLHNDTTGCCSGCGRVFRGLNAFDKHFGPRQENGRRPCLDPETATRTKKDGTEVPILERFGKSDPPIWIVWVHPDIRAKRVEELNERQS